MPATCCQELPGLSWTEDAMVAAGKGGKLRRFGSVAKACEMLDDCDVKAVYRLIQAGTIRAYQLRPHRPNSWYRVDLVSVWEFKQAQLSRRA